MDAYKEFDDFLAEYGINVLLVRQGKTLRCSCWGEKNQESPRDCPSCFGLGYVPVVEKQTCRYQVVGIPETLPRAVRPTPLGDFAVPAGEFFFRGNVDIHPKDLVLIVDWSGTGKPIYNGGGLFQIDTVNKQVLDRGKTLFVAAFVKDQPIQKDIRGVRIANVNGIKNYEILENRG